MNKKISQFTEKFSVDDDDYFVIQNGANNYKVSGATIKSTLQTETEAVETYTLQPNATREISLGSYTNYKTFWINYKSIRGTRERAGMWLVNAYSSSQAFVSEAAMMTVPEGFDETGGITNVEASVIDNQVTLEITTDNEDALTSALTIMVTRRI